ncbi:MAG: hypothetical protein WCX79_00740 [Candidatus Paceibacterota bacterium]|jgi:hypothetical protein
MTCPNAPYGIVDSAYIEGVEKYAGKKFTRIGKFNLELLCETLEKVCAETSGEVELLSLSDIEMPMGGKAGMFVIKYDGENYIALAGVRE